MTRRPRQLATASAGGATAIRHTSAGGSYGPLAAMNLDPFWPSEATHGTTDRASRGSVALVNRTAPVAARSTLSIGG
jgi:hypothetical protein